MHPNTIPCRCCNGTGRATFLLSDGREEYEQRGACPECNGRLTAECDWCLDADAVAVVGDAAICSACLDWARATGDAPTIPAPANDTAERAS